MTSEPTRNDDDGTAASVPSEQAAALSPREGATSEGAADSPRTGSIRPATSPPASGPKTTGKKKTSGAARSTSSSSPSRSSTPSTKPPRTAAAAGESTEAVAEPTTKRPAANRASAAKKPTAAGVKRTPDPVRSAAAKAAAARRKAAKEAAAREAAAQEEAAQEEAILGAPAREESAVAKGLAASDVRSDAPVSDAPVKDAPVSDAPVSDAPVSDAPVSDAPAGDANPPSSLPPLPQMSAEEAAAAFARVDPASNETSNRDEGLEAPSAPTVEHEDPTPPTGDSVSVPGEATDETSEPAPQPEGATRVPPASEASQLDATEPVRSPGFLERLRRALRGQPSLTSTSGASTSGAGRATADEVGEPVDATVSEDTISEDAAPGDAMVADEALVAEDPPPVGEGVFGDTLADNAGARDPHDDAGWELESPTQTDAVLAVRGLTKTFGDTRAVDDLDLDVHAGSFYGIVGPNGAGKTTTLSMITGLLRPDRGSVTVNGIDVWADPAAAKRTIGVLPDRLRVFDRLTGAQLLYYAGTLRGLKGAVVRSRVDDLAREFGLEDAMGRLVSDYSAGMVKKVSLAAAMIHSPRVLILDEPFESVDPVSAAKIVEILRVYVDNGGTVVLSSHSMDFIQRVCDHVAIIVEGQVLAAGAVEDVRGPVSLEARFLELAGGRKAAEGMEWLHSFSG